MLARNERGGGTVGIAPTLKVRMTMADGLDRGRDAFERQAWAEAHAHLAAADQVTVLEPEDLDRLAIAAYLIGKDTESGDTWARAHQLFLSRGEPGRAARCAFWLAFSLLNKGERARGGAWVTRARRLLADARTDCVEQGYLLLPVALQSVAAGDVAGANATFNEAAEIADRFGDRDLMAFAQHGQGRTLIRMGMTREGVTLLDQAMVAIETDGVSPLVVGAVYCGVIEGCLEICDLRRAQEWTAALTHWSESQPDLVPFSGQCLVHRAEILQLHGAWADAVDAAERACDQFRRGPVHPAGGAAFYQRAEIHRLRGEFNSAEEAYREASRWGKTSEPGLALLRLAQGQLHAAEAAIRRALDEARNRETRSRLLPVHVEIMLAASDIAAARSSASELAAMADDLDVPLLQAIAARSRGAVLLAEGDATAALAALRRAWTTWQDIEAPYEAARVRLLIGLTCNALGDKDAAEMEFDAARWVFQQLGAVPDLVRVEDLSRALRGKPAGGLTAREIQVLRLVAAGKTNRAIGAQLFISERTVERHLSNIFTKLDLSSRAAATAYAYEHQLV
jgi:DNA-binding CsgD family transcriptional regulator